MKLYTRLFHSTRTFIKEDLANSLKDLISQTHKDEGLAPEKLPIIMT